MSFLVPLEVLLTGSAEVARPCARAVSFAGQLAANCGAVVYAAPDFPLQQGRFTTRAWRLWDSTGVRSPEHWASEGDNRVVLSAMTPGTACDYPPGVSVVEISMEAWESEATLFAGSGLSDLLGDPERAPLFPKAHYAAASIGYAAFAALAGVYAKQRRFGESEVARLSGLGPMSWINWKAAAAGATGEDIHRAGDRAEWPVMRCTDGYVALIYTEREWPVLVQMIGDEALADPAFETFSGRLKNRERYLEIIRNWVATKTKAELSALLYESAIPGAPVLTPEDLLEDELLVHRCAFVTVNDPAGATIQTLAPPHRVAQTAAGRAAPAAFAKSRFDPSSALPLAGLKVLDLGIITAGAGTTGLLADLGAEVVKVEAETYPDPLRLWAGSSDSPLFKFNNRNKVGVAIDLKTSQGKAQFLALAADADVVVENFRRGVLDRLGMTFDALREANPNILLASVSGQGLDGSGSGHATYGSTLEASSGFSALTCYEDGVPVISGRNVNYPDQTVCLYGAAMIALAALKCRQDNFAMHLDVSQRDVAVYMLGERLEHLAAGGAGQPDADFALEGIFQGSDDRWVAIAVPSQQSADRLGLPSLSEPVLGEWVAQQTADQVERACREIGIGAATVLVGSEMLAARQRAGDDTFAASPTGDLVKGYPFQYQNTPMSVYRDAPRVGEHSKQYLTMKD